MQKQMGFLICFFYIKHMENKLSYRSVSPNLFKIWSRLFLTIILGGIVIGVMSQSVFHGIIISVGLGILSSVVQIFASYIVIIRKGENIEVKFWGEKYDYKIIKNLDSKWCYGFGAASPEMLAEGGSGKSQARINSISIVAEITFENGVVYFVEEIYMSDKFPNGIEYDHELSLKNKTVFKVWNVDQFRKALHL